MKGIKSSAEERVFRYVLLDDAKRIYRKYDVARDLRGLDSCCSFSPAGVPGIDLLDGQAVFIGLNHCKCRTSCPVCAYPRQLQMLDDISHAIWMARKKGHGVYLFNYTFSHKIDDEFEEIQRAYGEARQIMYRNGSFRLLCKSLGYVGRITDYEVQLSGSNGFHPHSHELVFMDDVLNMEDYADDYKEYFFNSLQKVGLYCDDEHGLKFLGYKGVGDYVTKMGAELTLQNFTKKSWGGGSLSPLQCLAMYHRTKREKFALDWLEYVLKVRHKRMIGFSRGLKDYLGLEEFKDDENVESERKNLFVFKHDDIRRLSYAEWRQMIEWINSGRIELVTEKLDKVKISYYLDDMGLQSYKDMVN